LTALKFVAAHPDKQKNYPLAIRFSSKTNQIWCFHISGRAGRRYLSASRNNPGDHWYTTVRFIAVSQPAAD
jgi:hypothetical protein